ncbi:hypothetical protein QJS04_geneDACA002088 [Acorus gramineus]|uniref:Uncharacterized protein n=1 Tax=Acorus gramineus TaxID=55184 RepID=A0AAV9A8W0_ACOGR|nr:hypothetical protein QJS04_geneDACA002088 [Acorus gramineus]
MEGEYMWVELKSSLNICNNVRRITKTKGQYILAEKKIKIKMTEAKFDCLRSNVTISITGLSLGALLILAEEVGVAQKKMDKSFPTTKNIEKMV